MVAQSVFASEQAAAVAAAAAAAAPGLPPQGAGQSHLPPLAFVMPSNVPHHSLPREGGAPHPRDAQLLSPWQHQPQHHPQYPSQQQQSAFMRAALAPSDAPCQPSNPAITPAMDRGQSLGLGDDQTGEEGLVSSSDEAGELEEASTSFTLIRPKATLARRRSDTAAWFGCEPVVHSRAGRVPKAYSSMATSQGSGKSTITPFDSLAMPIPCPSTGVAAGPPQVGVVGGA